MSPSFLGRFDDVITCHKEVEPQLARKNRPSTLPIGITSDPTFVGRARNSFRRELDPAAIFVNSMLLSGTLSVPICSGSNATSAGQDPAEPRVTISQLALAVGSGKTFAGEMPDGHEYGVTVEFCFTRNAYHISNGLARSKPLAGLLVETGSII